MSDKWAMRVFWFGVWVIVIGLALLYAARAGAQAEWSHGRLECQSPNIGTVVEAIKEPDGTVHSPHDIAYIGAQDPVRFADYVILPDHSYYAGCLFTERQPIVYEDWLYLPLLGGKYRSR